MDSKKGECDWRSATDKKSGRVYYYNVKTRATTWNKPLELASPEERLKMIAEKEATEQFFREMENNIMRRIQCAFREDEEKRFYEHMGSASEEQSTGRSDDLNDTAAERKKKVVTYGEDPPTTIIGVNMGKSRGRLGSDGSFDDGNSARMVMLDDSKEATPSFSKPRNSVRFNENLEQLELLRDTSSDLLYEASEGRSRCNSISGPARRVRTISTIDDEILMTMGNKPIDLIPKVQRAETVHPNRHSSMFVPTAQASNVNPSDIAESKLERELDNSSPLLGMKAGAKELGNRVSGRYPVVPQKVDAKDLLEAMDKKDSMSPSKKPRFSQRLKRRNSTGTIYLNNTMSQQNNNATIECVCVVIRAHMIDAAKEGIVPIEKYNVFKDPLYMKDSKSGDSKDDIDQIPSLSTVKEFFMYVFSKSQLESDCIIMALIYCERLVKETKGRLCIRYDNWRSILFSCLVMASKVWDDLSMWNVDFSQVYPTFNLMRVNELELAILDALKYSIRVSASEYAKYYFHLRSMMARLGFDDSLSHDCAPLDIQGARKLQLSTEKYMAEVDVGEKHRRRVHSVHVDLSALDMQRGSSVELSLGNGGSTKIMHASPKPHQVQLEQLIHAEHMDADGALHLSASSSFYGNLRTGSNANSFRATKPKSPAAAEHK